MKTGALALALVISAVQTVGWADCCCVLICKHQNDPCKECSEKPEAPEQEACCEESHQSAEETRCSHVQPSNEVASHATPLPPVVFDVVLQLPIVPFQAAPVDADPTDRPSCRSPGSPPLYLLNSVLLI